MLVDAPQQVDPTVSALIRLIQAHMAHDFPAEEVEPHSQDQRAALSASAETHQIGPLLWSPRGRRFFRGVPESEDEALDRRFRQHLQHNLRLSGEMKRILDLLSANTVGAMVIKGPVVAELAYGNLGLREFVDIDILVKSEHRLRAIEVISAAGYRASAAPMRFHEWNRQLEFFCAERDSSVEIHWGVVPRYFLPELRMAPWWQRSRRVAVAGTEVLTLCGEDHVALACIHGAKHGWRNLKWMGDLVGLMTRLSDIDWDLVIRSFESFGGQRVLALGVGLANDLFGVSAPSFIVARAKMDPVVRELKSMVLGSWSGGNSNSVSGLRFASMLLPGARSKLRLWWGGVTAPTLVDYEAFRLPEALHQGYSIVRPVRLMLKFVGRRPNRTHQKAVKTSKVIESRLHIDQYRSA